jgi:hypothetical protein
MTYTKPSTKYVMVNGHILDTTERDYIIISKEETRYDGASLYSVQCTTTGTYYYLYELSSTGYDLVGEIQDEFDELTEIKE